jgi:hypothetical protein
MEINWKSGKMCRKSFVLSVKFILIGRDWTEIGWGFWQTETQRPAKAGRQVGDLPHIKQ